MPSETRVDIALGLTVVLFEGWELESTVSSGDSFEISMTRDQTSATLRLIALGNYNEEEGFDLFQFNLLESLVKSGCNIEPGNTTAKGVIFATHPDRSEKIIHYIRKYNPLIHISVAFLSSDNRIKEVVSMADSIVVEAPLLPRNLEFGELVPLKLNLELWTNN